MREGGALNRAGGSSNINELGRRRSSRSRSSGSNESADGNKLVKRPSRSRSRSGGDGARGSRNSGPGRSNRDRHRRGGSRSNSAGSDADAAGRSSGEDEKVANGGGSDEERTRYKEKHRSSGGRRGDRDYKRERSYSGERDRKGRNYRSPSFSDPLLHFKAFCEMQRHSLSKDEFQRIYD